MFMLAFSPSTHLILKRVVVYEIHGLANEETRAPPEEQETAGPAAQMESTLPRTVRAVGWAALQPIEVGARGAERMQERQRAMLANLADYIVARDAGKPIAVTLRPYQQISFDRLYAHLMSPRFARSATRSALLHQVTNFGKTIVQAASLEAFGVGTRAADTEPAFSAVVLEPSIPLRSQTAARYREFLPQVPICEISDSANVPDLPVRLMTYKMCDALDEDELERLHAATDLFVLDEADCAIGPVRNRNIRRLMQNRLTLAFTATDGFVDYTSEKNALRTIHNTLGIETADYKSPREALEEGIMNGCQIFLVATGQEVQIVSKRASLTERDLAPLRTESGRDDLIIDIVQMMGEEGRTGLVKCIRGGDATYGTSAHARRLAERADGMWIIDSATGNPRQISATAIGNFNSKQHSQLLRQFDDGELDVLFYTSLLTRGLDSTRVEYYVAAEPSTSLTEMIQQFGRGARHKDKLAIYYQLIDTLKNSRWRLCTFLDVVGEAEDDSIEQGKIIGRPGLGSSSSSGRGRRPRSGSRKPSPVPSPEPDSGELDIDRLPPRLRSSVELLSGTVLSEITIVARQRPPEGWPRPTPLLREYGIAATSSLLHVLDQYPRAGDSEPPYVQIGSGRGGSYYLNPKAEAWARQSGLLESADYEMTTFPDIKREFGISEDKLNAVVEELSLKVQWRRQPNSMNKSTRCLSRADRERLRTYLAQEFIAFDPRKDVWIGDMAAELGRDRSYIRLKVGQHNKASPPEARWIFYPRRLPGAARPGFCLEPAQARAAMDEAGRHMPKGAVLLSELPERLGLPEDEAGRLLRSSPFRWKVVTRQVHTVEDDVTWLTVEDVDAFSAWIAGDRRDKSTFGIAQAALGSSLDAGEWDAVDRALFDLSMPRRVDRKPAELLAAVVFDAGRHGRLTARERQTMDALFHRRAVTLEVVAPLVAEGHIPRPERPLVVNMPRYLAARFDGFMAGAFNKILERAA